MPARPNRHTQCVVCQLQPPKYTCVSCGSHYCSVACYKRHKETCSYAIARPGRRSTPSHHTHVPLTYIHPTPPNPDSDPISSELDPNVYTGEKTQPTTSLEPLQDPTPLRPLTSLEWPYVPDTSAYPDPLTRDDPKPLQLHQYEAIATSSRIRTLLSNPSLRALLTTVDTLRGLEREEALQRALGVDSERLVNSDARPQLDEDTRAFRELAEAVEAAVRGRREDVLGLDWD